MKKNPKKLWRYAKCYFKIFLFLPSQRFKIPLEHGEKVGVVKSHKLQLCLIYIYVYYITCTILHVHVYVTQCDDCYKSKGPLPRLKGSILITFPS